ncbi:hypothetical protein VN1048_12060 [Helicobacter pylori]
MNNAPFNPIKSPKERFKNYRLCLCKLFYIYFKTPLSVFIINKSVDFYCILNIINRDA